MTEKEEGLAGQGEAEDKAVTSTDLDTIHKVPIEYIKVGAPARTIKPDMVEALAVSFRCLGQIHPVQLCRPQ
jgi:hypothetical protein